MIMSKAVQGALKYIPTLRAAVRIGITFWKAIWQSLPEVLRVLMSLFPVIPNLVSKCKEIMLKKSRHTKFYYNIIYYSQKLELAWMYNVRK